MAVANQVLIGLDAKLFRGSVGGPAVIEMLNIKDVTLDMTKGEVDISTRAGQGWKAIAATLKDATIKFDMVWKDGDADRGAILGAFFNNAPLAFYVSDGAPTPQGLDADFEVMGISKTEPLGGAQAMSVTIKPTFVTRAPAWV